MISFQNIISKFQQLDLTIIGALFTALYKATFLYLIVAYVWDGSAIEKSVTTICPPERKWYNLISFGSLEDCENLFSFFAKQKCIRETFIKDLSDVHHLALNLKKLPKTYYLIIATISQRLAPFVYQACLFLIPVLGLILLASTLAIMTRLGCDSSNSTGATKPALRNITSGTKLKNIICISGGILTTSLMICLISTHSLKDLNTACEAPSCLYCFPRLQNTIFRDQDEEDDIYYLTFGNSFSSYFLSLVKFASAIILSFLLYGMTALVVSFNAYVVLDTARSIYSAFKAVYETLAKVSASKSVGSFWNITKSAFFCPIKDFPSTPSLKDAFRRLTPKKEPKKEDCPVHPHNNREILED